MTDLLYLSDHYLKEFDAKIVEVPDPTLVVLDRTAIYPRGGGQPSDRGILYLSTGNPLNVVEAFKEGSKVIHRLSSSVDANSLLGKDVHGTVDWDLRYKHMRHHTALHILSGVVYHEFNSKITGGQIYPDKARLDLSMSDLAKDRIELIDSKMNKVVSENREVRVYWISSEQATEHPELYRLSADLLPKGLEKLRIVDIVGFDAQLDGGTHVARTREVGKIRISKTENKGRDNKRIEIVLGE